MYNSRSTSLDRARSHGHMVASQDDQASLFNSVISLVWPVKDNKTIYNSTITIIILILINKIKQISNYYTRKQKKLNNFPQM